jgi:monoamine oxidase
MSQNPAIAIIGGGVSGLYTAYRLVCRYPEWATRITVYEAGSRWGGRIHTDYIDSTTSIETGAGRVHGGHTDTLRMFKELGLFDKLRPIPSYPSMYYQGNRLYRADELHAHYGITRFESLRHCWEWLESQYRDQPFRLTPEPVVDGFLREVLEPHEYQWILSTIEFPSLLLLPISLGLPSVRTNFQATTYYRVNGGLSQCIHELSKRLYRAGVVCKLRHRLHNIRQHRTQLQLQINTPKGPIYSVVDRTYLSVYPSVLETYDIIHQIDPTLSVPKSVSGIPLCRIYAQFPLDPHTQTPWFQELSTCITDTPLGMIIPYNPTKGICMISYTEGHYATHWGAMGPAEWKQQVLRWLRKVFSNHTIPKPTWIKRYMWDTGCHRWKSNIQMETILNKIIDYQRNGIHLIGEAWTPERQGWMTPIV